MAPHIIITVHQNTIVNNDVNIITTTKPHPPPPPHSTHTTITKAISTIIAMAAIKKSLLPTPLQPQHDQRHHCYLHYLHHRQKYKHQYHDYYQHQYESIIILITTITNITTLLLLIFLRYIFKLPPFIIVDRRVNRVSRVWIGLLRVGSFRVEGNSASGHFGFRTFRFDILVTQVRIIRFRSFMTKLLSFKVKSI